MAERRRKKRLLVQANNDQSNNIISYKRGERPTISVDNIEIRRQKQWLLTADGQQPSCCDFGVVVLASLAATQKRQVRLDSIRSASPFLLSKNERPHWKYVVGHSHGSTRFRSFRDRVVSGTILFGFFLLSSSVRIDAASSGCACTWHAPTERYSKLGAASERRRVTSDIIL